MRKETGFTIKIKRGRIAVTKGSPWPYGWTEEEATERYDEEAKWLCDGESVALIDPDGNQVAYTGPIESAKLTFTLTPEEN